MKVYSIYCSDKYGYWTTKDLQCGAELRRSLLSSSFDESIIKNLEIVEDEEIGDIIAVEMSCVTLSLSKKAQSVFRPMIKSVSIERCSDYQLVIPPVVDALNFESSDITTFPNGNRIMAIRKHVFNMDKIKDLLIFLLPYGPVSVLATDKFVEKYQAYNFTGIEFRTIYEE